MRCRCGRSDDRCTLPHLSHSQKVPTRKLATWTERSGSCLTTTIPLGGVVTAGLLTRACNGTASSGQSRLQTHGVAELSEIFSAYVARDVSLRAWILGGSEDVDCWPRFDEGSSAVVGEEEDCGAVGDPGGLEEVVGHQRDA